MIFGRLVIYPQLGRPLMLNAPKSTTMGGAWALVKAQLEEREPGGWKVPRIPGQDEVRFCLEQSCPYVRETP